MYRTIKLSFIFSSTILLLGCDSISIGPFTLLTSTTDSTLINDINLANDISNECSKKLTNNHKSQSLIDRINNRYFNLEIFINKYASENLNSSKSQSGEITTPTSAIITCKVSYSPTNKERSFNKLSKCNQCISNSIDIFNKSYRSYIEKLNKQTTLIAEKSSKTGKELGELLKPPALASKTKSELEQIVNTAVRLQVVTEHFENIELNREAILEEMLKKNGIKEHLIMTHIHFLNKDFPLNAEKGKDFYASKKSMLDSLIRYSSFLLANWGEWDYKTTTNGEWIKTSFTTNNMEIFKQYSKLDDDFHIKHKKFLDVAKQLHG